MGRPRLDDEPIAMLLAAGRTPTEVSAALGVAYSTVYGRMRDPLFMARVAELRGQELAKFAVAAKGAVSDFLAVLHEIATNDGMGAGPRVNAARTGIEVALTLDREANVYPRLAALEAAQAGAGGDADDKGDDECPSPTSTDATRGSSPPTSPERTGSG